MEQLEKIIRYLDGEVIGEEKLQLEKEIETDKSLQQALHLVRDVNQTIADEQLLSFVNQLKETNEIFNKESASLQKKRTVMIWKTLAAACFVGIVIVSIYLITGNTKPSNDKIFANYYHRYEAELLTRSAEPSDVSDLIKAIQLYDKGNYLEAIIRFDAILKSDATNTAAHFFIGVSYIETKEYSKAIDNLNFVVTQNDTAFVEHAEWYLSLCYIKMNQMNKAMNLLHKIANGTTFYKVMASDVLHKMK